MFDIHLTRVDEDFLEGGIPKKPPVLQVIEIIPKSRLGDTDSKLYRLALSDGFHFFPAILPSTLAELVESKKLRQFSIIRVRQSHPYQSVSKKYIILIDIKCISESSGLIGSPKPFLAQEPPNQPPPLPAPAALPVVPISSLNPYIRVWQIRARVVQKSALREIQQRSADAKVFTVTLRDRSEFQIRGTFVGDKTAHFFKRIRVNQMYSISGGLIKLSNPQFTSLRHDCEIVFGDSTAFDMIDDDPLVGYLKFNFSAISDLKQMKPPLTVDVIGVICAILPAHITQSFDGTRTSKRMVEICDQSMMKIDLTLLNATADRIPEKAGTIVSVKDCKFTSFNGRTLVMTQQSLGCINQECPETDALRSWWGKFGGDAERFSSLSRPQAERITVPNVSSIESMGMGHTEGRSDFFWVVAVLSDLNSSCPLWYSACPNYECRDQCLSPAGDGLYYCKRCKKLYQEPSYRYILRMKISDWSGTATIVVVNNENLSSDVMGRSCAEWVELTRGKSEKFIRDKIEERLMVPISIKVKAKLDTYCKVKRVKLSAVEGRVVPFGEAAEVLMAKFTKLCLN